MGVEQWILLIWGVGVFVTFRWGSVPAMVQMRKRNQDRHAEYLDDEDRLPYVDPPAPLPIYIIIAALIALCWPMLVLHKLIWPNGIDAKAKKEARLQQEAEEEEARIKEAERVAREFNLQHPHGTWGEE